MKKPTKPNFSKLRKNWEQTMVKFARDNRITKTENYSNCAMIRKMKKEKEANNIKIYRTMHKTPTIKPVPIIASLENFDTIYENNVDHNTTVNSIEPTQRKRSENMDWATIT